jgi:hypothetical protein
MPALGKWGDRWFRHPGADMREPEKAVCWLTDIDFLEDESDKREDQLNHIARLHLKASLTAVDRFFMQVRRALTVAERGVISASADRRLWFGKNAYNPDVLVKLVAIFRTYFNYCEAGEYGKSRLCDWAWPAAASPLRTSFTSFRKRQPGAGLLAGQVHPKSASSLGRQRRRPRLPRRFVRLAHLAQRGE